MNVQSSDIEKKTFKLIILKQSQKIRVNFKNECGCEYCITFALEITRSELTYSLGSYFRLFFIELF